MPNSLWDMFQPQDAAGQPTDLGGALTGRSNSLIGLGLGLLSPSNPLRGQSSWGQGLEGFQAGAQIDARTAAAAAQLKQHRADQARAQANADRAFAQSKIADAYRREQDAREFGLKEQQFARGGEKPPETREVFDPTQGRNVVQEFDPKTRQWGTATTGGGTTATAPADPFTTSGAGRVYGGGGDYSPPAQVATPQAGQPVLPAKKPLTAHEQTAIDDADKAIIANRGVIGTLEDAKRLSKNAFSGPFATERAQIGSQIPDYLPGMSSNQTAKNTLLLNNAITSQAVEQLKATFGGNPSEGERKILLEMAGSVNSPDSVRQEIYDRAIKAANARLELNERRSREIRGGSYYSPGGDRAATPGGSTAPTGTAPKAGTVSKGYVFKGGDPSKEENWAPVR